MFTPGVSPQHRVFLLLLKCLHFTYPRPPAILQKRAWSVWNTSFARALYGPSLSVHPLCCGPWEHPRPCQALCASRPGPQRVREGSGTLFQGWQPEDRHLPVLWACHTSAHAPLPYPLPSSQALEEEGGWPFVPLGGGDLTHRGLSVLGKASISCHCASGLLCPLHPLPVGPAR